MTIDYDQRRQELRAARRAVPVADRMSAAESLAQRLLALPFLPTSGYVAGYWAMDGEIALHVWQLRLPPALTYCLPVLSGRQLRFAPWRPGDALTTNRFGIPEPDVQPADCIDPAAITMVVVPVVGFDRAGNRLGMGGGWYDRSFAFRKSQPAPPWLVGAAFASQELDELTARSWDVGLDAICTERDFLATDGTYP